MKRPKPGDRVLTFKINVSEIARTNKNKRQHPYDAVVKVLNTLLVDMATDPSVVAQSVLWNGVNCGDLRIDWRGP